MYILLFNKIAFILVIQVERYFNLLIVYKRRQFNIYIVVSECVKLIRHVYYFNYANKDVTFFFDVTIFNKQDLTNHTEHLFSYKKFHPRISRLYKIILKWREIIFI